MSEKKRQLVILVACGLEDERMSVAWSVANGGIKSGLDVTTVSAKALPTRCT